MTSAKARACIAISLLLRGKTDCRAFDNCFEEHDGTEVCREIVRQAHESNDLLAAINRHGYGYWMQDAELQPANHPTLF